MIEITNKARRPLSVPLPGGKKLHLGPGGTGQIPDRADQHPPLKKLIDEGSIEIVAAGHAPTTGGAGGVSRGGASQGAARSRIRRTGER